MISVKKVNSINATHFYKGSHLLTSGMPLSGDYISCISPPLKGPAWELISKYDVTSANPISKELAPFYPDMNVLITLRDDFMMYFRVEGDNVVIISHDGWEYKFPKNRFHMDLLTKI